jgi:putative ABC transport system permease protein
MSVRETVAFAFAALRGHRLRTGLSLVGVAIGVAAVVVLTALGEGARRYVVGQFRSLGTHLLIVIPGRAETSGGTPGWGGVPHDLTLEDTEALRREIPAVEKVAPVVMGTETVSHGERRRQVAVLGSTHELLEVRRLGMRAGRFLPVSASARGAPVAVLGAATARELFPGEEPVGAVVRIGGWRLRVIGVLAPRGTQLGLNMDEVAMVPVGTAMQMFDRRSLFRVIVQVRSTADLGPARAAVLRVLARRHGEEDVTCLRQDAVVDAFSSMLSALTMGLAAIAAISLAVAGLGIMNVMLVAVSERTAEVGLLKALGAERRQVLLVFLAEAVLIASSGGLLGLLAGGLGTRALVALYPDLPAQPPAWAVAAALGLSLAVGAVFGVLPARRATRLDPVSALAKR